MSAPTVAPSSASTAATAAAPKASLADRRQAILGAFHGDIEPVRTSGAYLLAAGLVALVMVLLPVVYLAFIWLVGYVTYWHAVNDVGVLATKVRGKGYFFILLAYFGPIAIGGIIILFLIKPLFARAAKRTKNRSLTRQDEPLLFEFVDRICKAVGAPRPKRIDVDLQVNASASFRRGIWSMFGNDLVLTIGLPLVAGLRAREFGGVLGHEFGHFAQGAGMRLSYLIRSISFWFTRVVYERDVWDERLESWTRSEEWSLMLIGYLAKAGVGLGRLVLRGLMYVGFAVSGVMLRQMEFDADLHEIRMSGSDTFESSSKKIALLGVSLNGAYSDLGEFYRDGKLVDDLPGLVLSNYRTMPAEVSAHVAKAADEARTGWLDTHPCDRERIAHARRAAARGVFDYDGEATELFGDFATLAKECTWDYYKEVLDSRLKQSDLRPLDSLLADQQAENRQGAALSRYFLDGFRVKRLLALPPEPPVAPADPAAVVARLDQVRTALSGERGAKPAAEFDPTEEFYRRAEWRLVSALSLLQSPATAEKLPETEALRSELATIYPACRAVHHETPAMIELSEAFGALVDSLENLSKKNQVETYRARIPAQMNRLTQLLTQVLVKFKNEAYPLDHADGATTLARMVLERAPDENDLGQVYEATSGALDNFAVLSLRLTGRLARIAEQVEAAWGLPPLETPKEATTNDGGSP